MILTKHRNIIGRFVGVVGMILDKLLEISVEQDSPFLLCGVPWRNYTRPLENFLICDDIVLLSVLQQRRSTRDRSLFIFILPWTSIGLGAFFFERAEAVQSRHLIAAFKHKMIPTSPLAA